MSEPKPYADHAVIRDRFILDGPAFVRWCMREFQIWEQDAALERITDIDPLAERVVIDGQAYQIPDECYQNIMPDSYDNKNQASARVRHAHP